MRPNEPGRARGASGRHEGTAGTPRTDPTDDAIRHAVDVLAHAATCCSGHAPAPSPPPSSASPDARTAALPSRGLVPRSTAFLLPNVIVVEPERPRLEGVDVVVTNGRIESIRPVQQRAPDDRLEILDRYEGCFVLPGLIDMHAHLPPDNVLDLGGLFALLHLSHGITSVRDAGDIDGTAVAGVRRGMGEQRYDGPRLFCAGLFITAGRPRWKNSIVMHSPDEADAVARRLQAEGHHSMKLYENLTLDMIRALVDAASRYRLRVLGHVPTPIAYETARLPDAQHFFGVAPPDSLRRDHVFNRAADWEHVTPERLHTIVETAVAHQLANTPTLVVAQKLFEYERYADAVHDRKYQLLPRLYRAVVWNPSSGLPVYRGLGADDFARLHDAFGKKLELVRMLFDAGARLHLGTDVQQPFVVPGASLIEEMRLFERAGIGPAAICRLATRGAAEYLAVDDLGEVRPGALADLLVCASDPVVDLSHLTTLRAVVSRGALMDKAALDARLAAERRRHETFFADRVEPALARVQMWRLARNFVN